MIGYQSFFSIQYPNIWNTVYRTYCSADVTPSHVTLTSHYPKLQETLMIIAGYCQLGLGLIFNSYTIIVMITLLFPYWYIHQLYQTITNANQHSMTMESITETTFNSITLSQAIQYTDHLRTYNKYYYRIYLLFFLAYCLLIIPSFINWVTLDSLSPELASWYAIPSLVIPLKGSMGIDICAPCDIHTNSNCYYRYTKEGLLTLFSIGGRVTYAFYGIILALAIPDIATIITSILTIKLRDIVQIQTREHIDGFSSN